MGNFLIYGSYGYTGQLIVDLAIKEGLHPILAGRDGVLQGGATETHPFRLLLRNQATNLAWR